MYLSTLLKIAVVGLLAISSGFGYLYFKQNDTKTETKFEETKTEMEVHKCVHDEYMKDQELFVYEQLPSPVEATLAHEEKLIRQHKSGNWQPIRVHPDFSNLQEISVQYSYYRGTLTCPEISRFCDYSSRCPNSCSGRGTCKVDTCDCWDGFGGDDCSQITE